MMRPLILGAVLAGGRANRFGSDKALALFEGRPLIEHALAALAPHTDALFVAGREWSGVESGPDRPGPGLGPLGGLNAALHRAREIGADRVLTIGCDTPQVPAAILRDLIERETAGFLDRLPVIGMWPPSLASALDAFVATDPKRSVRGWAAACGADAIDAPPLANINRPQDLAALQSR